jgi:hypothetical protein
VVETDAKQTNYSNKEGDHDKIKISTSSWCIHMTSFDYWHFFFGTAASPVMYVLLNVTRMPTRMATSLILTWLPSVIIGQMQRTFMKI